MPNQKDIGKKEFNLDDYYNVGNNYNNSILEEFRIIGRMIMAFAVILVILDSIFYIVLLLKSYSFIEVKLTFIMFSLLMIAIAFAYLILGMIVGTKTMLASASISAWTRSKNAEKGMRRSIREYRKYISMGAISYFFIFAGVVNLFIFAVLLH